MSDGLYQINYFQALIILNRYIDDFFFIVIKSIQCLFASYLLKILILKKIKLISIKQGQILHLKQKKQNLQFQCMSYVSKFNPNDDNYLKKTPFRKPFKKRINDFFSDDLILDSKNPFLQQLAPWNGSSKLQSSINLLKKEIEAKNILKNQSIQLAEPSVQRIVSHDSIDYTALAFHLPNQESQQESSRYACPRLKISSQQVIVSKNPKQEVKRFFLNKKPLSQNKNLKKIPNLTIQWDEDIVYNPEKKYFEEQNLKRKILREFSQTRKENRNQISKKELKVQDKVFKLQFKNNKIYRKQISVFQYKKKDNSLSLDKNRIHDEKQLGKTHFLETINEKQTNQNTHEVKVSNLNFEPKPIRKNSIQLQGQKSLQEPKIFQSDKWKFRTSLKTRRSISIQKGNLKNCSKTQSKHKRLLHKYESTEMNDKETINRITLQLNQNLKQQNFTPIQVFAKTSPHFFKKTVQ